MQRMVNPNALPPNVAEALRRGNKIEAIKLLREVTKLGLAEAKGMIDAIEAHQKGGTTPTAAAPRKPMKHVQAPVRARPREDDLSPGEVPRSSSFNAAIALIVLAAAAVGVWIVLK
jgi:hypothetical protein